MRVAATARAIVLAGTVAPAVLPGIAVLLNARIGARPVALSSRRPGVRPFRPRAGRGIGRPGPTTVRNGPRLAGIHAPAGLGGNITKDCGNVKRIVFRLGHHEAPPGEPAGSSAGATGAPSG